MRTRQKKYFHWRTHWMMLAQISSSACRLFRNLGRWGSGPLQKNEQSLQKTFHSCCIDIHIMALNWFLSCKIYSPLVYHIFYFTVNFSCWIFRLKPWFTFIQSGWVHCNLNRFKGMIPCQSSHLPSVPGIFRRWVHPCLTSSGWIVWVC